MNRLRVLFGLFAVIAIALVVGGRGNAAFMQQQRDQIAVYILVNVTPAPVAYAPRHDEPAHIGMRMGLRARGSGDFVDVPNVRLGNLVAQQQSAIRVQAEVSPNPLATLLYSNAPEVVINQQAGTTQTTPACVYTVTVDTTLSWTLKDGLSSDFVSGSWNGNTLKDNFYLQTGTPQAVATPFIVYPDNNNTWNTKAASSGMKTYCVTLTLTVPSNIGQGAYTTNAIYTLYY